MATPNMGLVLPAVGVTVGPLWASELNTALEAVDAHDHTNGNGLPITPEALNIDSPVDFQGYGLQAVDEVQLVSKAATVATPGAVYAVSGDLWYTNAAGTAVQITVGGVIAGAAGSISGLADPASASFNSATGSFRWNATAATRAELDAATLRLRSAGGVSAAWILLSAPGAGVTSYTLQFPPTAPASVSRFLFTSTTGVSSWVQPDASTVEVSGTTLRVKDLGITTAKLAASAVTTSKIATSAVEEDKIATSAVTTDKIAGGAVINTKVAVDAISTVKIQDSAVTTAKIAGGNVTEDKIATSAVTTDKIAGGAVINTKVAVDAISTTKIQDSAVTTIKIADSNVTTDKIANLNVTTDKIANLNVTTDKIANLNVTTSKIAAGAVNGSTGVTMDKLSPRITVVSQSGTFFYTGSSYQQIVTASIAVAAGVMRVCLQPRGNTAGAVGRLVFESVFGSQDLGFIKLSITGAQTFDYEWAFKTSPTSAFDCYWPSAAINVTGGSYTATWYVRGSAAGDQWRPANFETVLTQG